MPLVSSRAFYRLYSGASVTSRPYPGPGQNGLMLTPGWNAVAGTRPMGAPVGLGVAPDGAIWVAEDKNGTILRIAADRP